jgi:hypothetical protein
MDTQLERDLRTALATRAAELDETAGASVLAHDLRPRSNVARIALAGGGATVAIGAIVAILAVSLSTETPRAFAGWSAIPTTVTAGQAVRAEGACRSRLPISAGTTGPHSPQDTPQIAAGGWQTILTDVRGPYTMMLFTAADGQAVFSCFSGRNPGEVSLGGAFAAHRVAAVPAGQIDVQSSGGNTTPPDEGSAQFSRLVGRTGPGVRAVSLRLSDGTQVTASTTNGWFLAWWPGTPRITAAEVTTASGTQLQPMGSQLAPEPTTSSPR